MQKIQTMTKLSCQINQSIVWVAEDTGTDQIIVPNRSINPMSCKRYRQWPSIVSNQSINRMSCRRYRRWPNDRVKSINQPYELRKIQALTKWSCQINQSTLWVAKDTDNDQVSCQINQSTVWVAEDTDTDQMIVSNQSINRMSCGRYRHWPNNRAKSINQPYELQKIQTMTKWSCQINQSTVRRPCSSELNFVHRKYSQIISCSFVVIFWFAEE